MKPFRRKNPGRGVCVRVFFIWMLLLAAESSRADLPPNTACPLDFFTNVASRLLSSEMHMDLDHIQVYPTNQYTPAVHRLLQVTANIYDATTTNCYPSVFRPLFWKTNELNGEGVAETNVYIAGYQYVKEPLTNNSQPIFAPPTDASASSIPFGFSYTNNIYGIPWVIGAKKGLPNFNALELDSCFFIERKLQFNRNNADVAAAGTLFPYGRIYTTNQMYIIGLSNILGVDFWNSYASNYDGPVTIVVRDTLSTQLTNDALGFTPVANIWSTNVYMTVVSWPGSASASSFVLPLGTNVVIPQYLTLPQAPASANGSYVYYYGPGPVNIEGFDFDGPCFIPAALDPINFMNAGTPPLPHFVLTVTNRLQAWIIDSNHCILDYVQLGDMTSSLDINEAIADNTIINPATEQGYTTGLWSTNYYPGGGSTPYGVLEQFFVSTGSPVPAVDQTGGFWSTGPIPGTSNTGPTAQQAFFQAFFSPNDAAPYYDSYAEILTNGYLSILAPFTPARLVVQRIVYAANDPLIHYLTSDLNDPADDTNSLFLDNPPLKFLGRASPRYMPWGAVGTSWPAGSGAYDNNPYNLAYKDPLVSSSDGWEFPTSQSLNASWLGQIHRGTPWQTIFLKSTNILNLTQTVGNITIPSGLNTWELWTGDANPADAVNMAPIQDWHLAALLASLFNTNDIASLFSVNDGSRTDWENLLNGMTVLTNNLPDVVVGSGFNRSTRFAALTISSNTIQAATIAGAIQSARANSPGGVIANVGDIFAVPQLSDDSPYLNTDLAQTEHGISDAAYEAIPSQLLPLLWEDSVGSVSPADGQIVFQFTGDDNHAYAIQVSSDLRTWTTVETNCPVNGIFAVTNTATAGPRFYRTVLVQ